MFEENKAVVKQWLDLVGGDPDEVWESYKATMSPDMVWRLIGATPISGKYVGLDSVANNFFARCWKGDGRKSEAVQGLDPEYGIKPLDVREVVALEDGRVIVHCFSNGRGKNGVPYINEYCWLIKVENGKITRLDEFADTALIERAIFNKEIIPAEQV